MIYIHQYESSPCVADVRPTWSTTIATLAHQQQPVDSARRWQVRRPTATNRKRKLVSTRNNRRWLQCVLNHSVLIKLIGFIMFLH